MERIDLPGGHVSLSRVAFGCSGIGGHDYGPVDDAESIASVHRALECGITTFDTADVYGLGRSERVLAQALRGRRHEAELATKGGVRWSEDGRTERTLEPAYLVRALDASLGRLETDHVELYQLHWRVDGAALDDAMDALLRCRDAGKVLAIGCCNFRTEEVAALAARGPLATEQLRYNLIDRALEPVLRAATSAGRITMTYNSVAQGLFAGGHRAREDFAGTDLRARYGYFKSERLAAHLAVVGRLEQIGRQRGRTSLQVGLRWALDQPWVGVAIAGMKHPWQVTEIAGASDWALTDDERSELESAAAVPQPT